MELAVSNVVRAGGQRSTQRPSTACFCLDRAQVGAVCQAAAFHAQTCGACVYAVDEDAAAGGRESCLITARTSSGALRGSVSVI